MKQKLSITIDEEKIAKVGKLLNTGKFRNISHIFEFSLDKLLEKEND